MKRIAVICLFLVFASCETSINKENLLGSWTTVQDKSKNQKRAILDRVTFFRNDSFQVKMYLNGTLQDSFSGKYFLDEKRKLISTKIDTVEFKFKVMELTHNKLSTKSEKMKTISHYRKL